MRDVIATVYAFGFHPPKAMHSLIVRNWTSVAFVNFVFLTDCADSWKAILPESASNIEVIQIDIEEVFELSLPLLGVHSFSQLKRERGWLFSPHEFQMGGYLGCQLRPALSTLLPRRRTRYWGWIDNDVFINPRILEKHLRSTSAELLLYPNEGLAWEQFKLFSTDVNTTMAFKEFIDLLSDNKSPFAGPMEARFVYHMRDIRKYRNDDVKQSQLAIHWAYSDSLAKQHGPLANQYPVCLSADVAALSGPNNQQVLFFNADTQVKQIDAAATQNIEACLQQGNGYTFDYIPCC